MPDRLDEYRRKRDPARTPEPVPQSPPAPREPGRRFVIQQHHARSLHWDVRLERDGVLVSFAVPRGLPRDQARNHLAKHTEDHPLEYLDFAGEIPAGEYGGGRMTIFDAGTYETGKWRSDEISVTFHGDRTKGRYVFFQTDGADWMVRRMDPPEPGWEPMPADLSPMLATRAGTLPPDDADWGYELAWGGQRVLTYLSGGRVRLSGPGGKELISLFPEVRALGPALAPVEAIFDGELVAFDGTRPAADQTARTARTRNPRPVQLLLYDLLWLDGHRTTELLRYAERRELLDDLAPAGPHWQTPPYFPGGGRFALDAARSQGLSGVVAKRLDSPYLPGRTTRLWLDIEVS
ncbi:ATP-dependent DNA ligase [Actinoplanes sp. SE50]|uniref:DNA polymerase ligase N-terminal domain-containing protein n=1 Tax=unclassified Actinoplanes TaxID=2626549 RepID=UPI00023ECA95|nr:MULTISPECIES: DNA polymerase ligase N-terminal domain-containing protein [unclassified Actinoplanes]AEV82051.1 DNA ligase (ATP) [Actinoplanes sp. SE50/110]ATO80450.1 ATP-dependent DNA ligase [Actinoplanes sp. SE50]SLL97857.1 ATP-dependent DNA ligase [Actinoplanes sp. SE50/110]